MDLSKKLMEQILRSEGYAEGFRAGFAACAQWIANEMQKNQDMPVSKTEGERNND